MWDPDPSALAQDYLVLQHNKNNGEIIMILWMADPMVDGNIPGAEQAREILRESPTVGLTHISVDEHGQFLDLTGTPTFRNTRGDIVQPIPDSQLPPATLNIKLTMRNVFSQNLGVMGQFVQWYNLPPRGIDACQPGQLIVSYGSENYDFQTPVPGC